MINKIIVLLLALGAPLSVLPLQAPWGFERSVLLIAVFLGLVAWKLATNVVATHGSPKEGAGHAPQLQRVVLIAAAALPVAAFLSAPTPDVRFVHLASLELWAAVGGVLLPVVATHASPKKEAGHAPQLQLLALTAGVIVAVISLIRPISPITAGPKGGLDYKTSLAITSATLQKEPLWGVGPYKFGESFLRYKTAEFNAREDWVLRYNGSQSGLLELAAEYGLIGLIGPIGLIGLILADLQRRRQEVSSLMFYLRAGLVGVVVAAFVLLPYSPGVFWALAMVVQNAELKVQNQVKS